MPASAPRVAQLHDGILAGDRTRIGQAITRVESTRPQDRIDAAELIRGLVAHQSSTAAPAARRVGITGVPGVGKSTFIDALGSDLTAAGHRVAVLAVDPSSSVTGGSILGDKTRMERLSMDPRAFIRPSPASGHLGGVGRATREAMIVLESAGYDVVLVETVGVGQSETVVAEMVDFFLVLMLPGAGDELQGIKKGVLELADMVAVNKADANPEQTQLAVRDYSAALRLLTPTSAHWQPPVMSCSGLTGQGLKDLWDQIELHHQKLEQVGELQAKRQRQQVRWMWSLIDDRLRREMHATPEVSGAVTAAEEDVRLGRLGAPEAADHLVDLFFGR